MVLSAAAVAAEAYGTESDELSLLQYSPPGTCTAVSLPKAHHRSQSPARRIRLLIETGIASSRFTKADDQTDRAAEQ